MIDYGVSAYEALRQCRRYGQESQWENRVAALIVQHRRFRKHGIVSLCLTKLKNFALQAVTPPALHKLIQHLLTHGRVALRLIELKGFALMVATLPALRKRTQVSPKHGIVALRLAEPLNLVNARDALGNKAAIVVLENQAFRMNSLTQIKDEMA